MDYEITQVPFLNENDKQSMFELMKDNYSGVNRAVFLKDLHEKDYVIILKSKDRLCGFSTFALSQHNINGRNIRLAFSGDTVISKENRNSRQLPVSFGVLMNRIEKLSDEPLYWMLISKGFRTYRFLPVYFKEFYPVYNRDTPGPEKELIDSLGKKLFPKRYREDLGIISSSGQAVKNFLEDQQVINQRDDEHIQFFNTKNKNWPQGDELLCLVRYNRKNLNPFISKILDLEESKATQPVS